MVAMRVMATVAAVLALSAIGCGSGLSKEDAEIVCEQDRTSLSAFFDDAVFDQCVACYEDCGNACARQATSPISYTCSTSTGAGGSK